MSSSKTFREQVIGLGDTSAAKSYYPQLRKQIDELKRNKAKLEATLKDLEEAREEAEESEKIFRQLFENTRTILNSISDGVVAVDESGNVSNINPVAGKMVGKTFAEVIGKPVNEIVVLEDEFTGMRLENPALKVLNTENEHCIKNNAVLISGSGEKYSVECCGSPILTSNGSTVGVVLVIRDITSKLMTERQLLQAQKMETIGVLAGGIAHDFNNMLGGITGPVSLIKAKFKREPVISGEFLKKQLDTIETSSKRASDMVNQLLTISYEEKLALQEHDLKDTINRVIDIGRLSFDKSVEIVTTLPDEEVTIKGDPTQLEQMLLNLCVNAAHSMTDMRTEGDRNGGRINIAVDKVRADNFFIKTHPTAALIDYWVLSVKDEGIGIKKGDLSKIFMPFFSTKNKSRGTGLGLSMVYNIVDKHCGVIEVYSELKVGTTFKIYLPVMGKSNESTVIRNDARVYSGEGQILVIDDEEVMRETAGEILRTCGYSVIAAKDGAEGLELYKVNCKKIKGVLLDMVMPGMAAGDVLEELISIKPDVKVVLVSGFNRDDRVDRLFEMGVCDFAQKPYTLESLSTVIKHTFG